MNFSELAVLVKDIHENYFDLQADQTIPIISSDNNKKTYYKYVLNAVAVRGIEEIEILSLDYQKNHILGRFQKYRTHTNIWISKDLNSCWKRYVAAKELSHLIVDTKNSAMTTDIRATVMWMIRDGMCISANDALSSEHIAAQFAAELLLPYKYTQALLEDNSVNEMDIAKQFKVPLRIIQTMRFTENYLSNRRAAYED